MVAFTANFRLAKPDFNSEGWDTQLNADLDAIDSLLGQFNTGLTIQGVWLNATLYTAGIAVVDAVTGHIWQLSTTYTSSSAPGTFAQDRALYPSYWTDITNPAISAAASATNAQISANNAAASYNSITALVGVGPSTGTGVLVLATSPTLLGSPLSPTAAPGNNTTQIATTAFVTAANAVVTGQAMENIGRNVAHNGEFLVQQRGLGPWVSGYGADRWLTLFSTSTISTTIAALVDADRTAIGDEAALFSLKNAVTGTSGAADFAANEHRLESVQRYGGKSVTVSFWAKAASGTPSIGVGANQNFGTGGSPSAAVIINATPVVISTTWTRYTVTLALPTTIGKTLGTTAGTDYTAIKLWYSSGATNNTAAGGIGVQSATISLWGVQIEVGTVATTFEKKSYGQHWQDCLRFYYAITTWVASISTYVTGVTFPVPMRATPVATGGGAGFSQTVLNAQNAMHGQTGAATQAMTYSADL